MEPQAQSIILRASRDMNLREVPEGSNDGDRLRRVLRKTPFRPGERWCYYWALAVMIDVFGSESQLPQSIAFTGSCQQAAMNARALSRLAGSPATGCIFVLRNQDGHFHHAGIVTKVLELTHEFETVEGNTNENGGSEGYGVFAHTRILGSHFQFITW